MTGAGLRRVPGFVLEQPLDALTGARIWRARTSHGAHVVLEKIDCAPDADREQSWALAHQLTRIIHRNLVRLHDVLTLQDALILVGAFAERGSLAERMGARGPIRSRDLLGVLASVAAGLAHTHDAGVWHGNIGPTRVLFDAGGNPLLAGAGVAEVRQVAAGLRSAPFDMASAAPQDVFGLGAVAILALTGTDLAGSSAIGRDPTRLRALLTSSAAPADVRAVLSAALEVEPQHRPAAAQFADRLARVAGPRPAAAAGAGPARRPTAAPAIVSASTGLLPAPDRSILGLPSSGTPSSGLPSSGTPIPDSPSEPVPGAARSNLPGRQVLDAPDGPAPAPPGRPAVRHVGRHQRARPPSAAARMQATLRSGRTRIRGRPRAPRWRGGFGSRPSVLAAAATAVIIMLAGALWWHGSVGQAARPAIAAAATPPPARTPTTHVPAGRDTSIHSPPTSDSATSGASGTASTPARRAGGSPSVRSGPAAGTPASSAGSAGAAASLDAAAAGRLLAALDTSRVAAFAQRAPELLRKVYVPGPLLDQDSALLAQLVPRRCGLLGARTDYRVLKVDAPTPEGLAVTVTAALERSTLVCAGRARGVAPGIGATRLRIVITETAGGYRIAGLQRI